MLCLVACTAPVTAQRGERAPHPTIGRPAPAWDVGHWFQLPPGKESLSVEDFGGRVVYLYGFQSWCPGCHKHGFPTLQKLVRRYAGDNRVAFAAVQTVFEGFGANTLAQAKKTAAHYELAIPFGHDAGPENSGSRLMRAYRTRGTPWTIVIDRGGVVRYSDFHISFDKAVELIDRLAVPDQPTNPLVGQAIGDVSGLRWISGGDEPRGFGTQELTLVRWWTTGCRFCKSSIPDLARLERTYRDRGLRMVAVYHQKSPGPRSDDELVAYLGELGYEGPAAIDPDWKKLRELMRRGDLDGATSVSCLVDKQGIVRWVHPGPRIHRSEDPKHARADADMRELEAIVDRLLPAKRGR